MASLAVDGYALAALLADAVSSTGDVDGILLGSARVQCSSRVTDATDRPNEVLSTVLLLRGHVCSASLVSWYDAAGAVDEDALARLLRAADDAPLLGWFVARRASPLTPSARETEVWRSLQRRAARLALPPLLFALVSSDQPADGQPYSTQFVFFAPPEAPQQTPSPLPVTVLNVGSARSARRVPDAPSPSTGWHPLLDGTASWRALEAAAAQGAEQTCGAYEAALQRATALCLEVERADDALHASRERARLSALPLDDALSEDEAHAALDAVELPTADEPPAVLLSAADTAAPVGVPSILDEILADEAAAADKSNCTAIAQ